MHKRSAARPQRSHSILGEIIRSNFLFQFPCHLGAENKMDELVHGKTRMCLVWVNVLGQFISLKTFHYQSGVEKTSSFSKYYDFSSSFLSRSFKTVKKLLKLRNNLNSKIIKLKTYISLLFKF